MPMQQYAQPGATPQNFKLCHGYACTLRTNVHLSDKDWRSVLRLFKPAAKSSEAERVQITKAIARMETFAVKSSGIPPDRGHASRVRDDLYQMDCIDETVNTDLYLRFLEEAGVLKFHTRALPLHRGYFIDGTWPHNAAAVQEIASGKIYAIDSFYHDNGTKVDAVVKRVWLQGWRPD